VHSHKNHCKDILETKNGYLSYLTVIIEVNKSLTVVIGYNHCRNIFENLSPCFLFILVKQKLSTSMEETMNTTDYQSKVFQRNLQIIRALEEGFTPKEVASQFRVCVATVYNIRKLASEVGIRGLIPKSRAPKTKPQKDPVIIQMILQCRQETGYGSEKIYDYLMDKVDQLAIDYRNVPKPRTIHEILRRSGQVIPVKPRKTREKVDYYRLRAVERPGEIIEADMKTDHYLGGKPVIANGIIDICSRVVTVGVGDNQTTEDASINLIEHVYRWGVPNSVKTDNDMAYMGQVEGSSFGHFTRLCLLLGIEQIFIPIRQPRWNPFIESFFRTWDKEFYNGIYHWGWDALIQGNRGFVQRYLVNRSHQGIKRQKNNPHKIMTPQKYHETYGEMRTPSWKKEHLIEIIRKGDMPLSKGIVTFIRKVSKKGEMRFKQNRFSIPSSYAGMFVKGIIHVEPDRHNMHVDFYFREHKITSGIYRMKTYRRGKL
jgi:transposase